MFSQGKPDYQLICLIGVILCVGLIMLSPATSVLSFTETKTSYFFVMRQITRGVIPGALFFLIALKFNYRKYRRLTPFFLVITIALLLLVFIPFLGSVQNGVKGWIRLAGITIQTSEIAKLTFILWLAGWLASHEGSIRSLKKTSIPFFIVSALVAGLIMLQPDMGTMLIFAAVAFVMFFAARARMSHIVLLVAISALIALPIIISARYRFQRILQFWNPNNDIQGAGYQIRQALIALGSGSWRGVGIGRSQQKFQFLPEIESDSIFAIIGEEGGFFSQALLSFFLRCFLSAV